MKEMLFITVAILIPPTLTYMGFVGNDLPTESSREWQSAELQRTGTNESGQVQQPVASRDRWYESSL